MIQPPKMSPAGLVSAGIATVRSESSPRGCGWSVDMGARSPFPAGPQAGRARRYDAARSRRGSGQASGCARYARNTEQKRAAL